MRLLSTLICFGFLCSISPAYADEWDKLFNDVDMLNELFDAQHKDIKADLVNATIEQSDDLFPLLENETDEERQQQNTTHVTATVNGVPVTFEDVPLYQWFAPYVRDVAERGLVSGYRDSEGVLTGEFGPADNVTVEQLAKMAIEARQYDIYQCNNEIKNESAIDSWSEQYIRCAESLGWVLFSDGSVNVQRKASRAEVVVTVLQAFSIRIPPRSGTVFEDVTTATEFGAAVEKAYADNIVSGYSNSSGEDLGIFGPEDPVNRAETAKIFSLAFQVYQSE